MPDFPRLPSHMRVVRLLGLLCLFASFLLFGKLFTTILSSFSLDSWHMLMMGVNLLILGGTCFTMVRTYCARISQANGGPLPLSARQSQVRAIVVWMALPLGALTLAVFIPPTADAFGAVFPVSLLAGVVLITARSLARESSRSVRTPGTG